MRRVLRDLTVLVFGFRKSEIYAWLRRHRGRNLESVRFLSAYRLDDVPTDPAVEAACTMLQGAYSGFARIKQCLPLIDTRHVLLVAGDDDILRLPHDIDGCPASAAIAGSAYFQEGRQLRPSSNNSLDLAAPTAHVLRQYWTLPNPGDNCLFYSMFPTEPFTRLFAETGEYEGSDYHFVHRFLLECAFVRSPSFILLRQPPPLENHYTRRFLERLSPARLNKASWPFHNPLLRALRDIHAVTPETLVPILRPFWSEWIRLKYDEMARASKEYHSLIKEVDTARLSFELTEMLPMIEESHLPPPC
jgi:hypothetical protein